MTMKTAEEWVKDFPGEHRDCTQARGTCESGCIFQRQYIRAIQADAIRAAMEGCNIVEHHYQGLLAKRGRYGDQHIVARTIAGCRLFLGTVEPKEG